MKYEYLVNYQFNNKHGGGMGTLQLYRTSKIRSFDDLNEIADVIVESNEGLTDVMVSSYILVRRRWK